MKFVRNYIIATILIFIVTLCFGYELSYKSERAGLRSSYMRKKLHKRNLKRNTRAKISSYSNLKNRMHHSKTNAYVIPLGTWTLLHNWDGNGLCIAGTTDEGKMNQIHCNNKEFNQYFWMEKKSTERIDGYIFKNLNGEYVSLYTSKNGVRMSLTKKYDNAEIFLVEGPKKKGLYIIKNSSGKCIDSNLNDDKGNKLGLSDCKDNKTQYWRFLDPDTLQKFLLRSRGAQKYCATGGEEDQQFQIIQTKCHSENVYQQFSLSHMDNHVFIRSSGKTKFYMTDFDREKYVKLTKLDWDNNDSINKSYWSIKKDDNNAFVKITNIGSGQCLNGPEKSTQKFVSTETCGDEDHQKYDLLAIGLDSYSWNIKNDKGGCLQFFNDINNKQTLMFIDCKSSSINQQFKFALNGLAYKIQAYDSKLEKELYIGWENDEFTFKEDENSTQNWEMIFDGKSYSIFSVESKKCLIRKNEKFPNIGECNDERWSVMPVGSQILEELNPGKNDECFYNKIEGKCDDFEADDLKKLVDGIIEASDDSKSNDDDDEEVKKKKKKSSTMNSLQVISEILNLKAGICYGGWSAEDILSKEKTAKDKQCERFPLNSKNPNKFGIFAAMANGIPCGGTAQVDFNGCFLWDKCHTYGLVLNSGPLQCIAAAGGDSLGGFGKFAAAAAETVKSVGVGYSYSKRYSKSFSIFSYDVSGGVFEIRKVTAVGHIWAGGAFEIKFKSLENIKIGKKKLSEFLSFEAQIDILVDFGNAADIIKKWIGTFKTFNSEDTSSITQDGVKPTFFDNTAVMLESLLNARGEFSVSAIATLKISLEEISKGILPDIELASQFSLLITQGGGTSGMPGGMYFYVTVPTIVDVIAKLIEHFTPFMKLFNIEIPNLDNLQSDSTTALGLAITADYIAIHVTYTVIKFSCSYRFENYSISCDFGGDSIMSAAVKLIGETYDLVVFKSKALFHRAKEVVTEKLQEIKDTGRKWWQKIKEKFGSKNRMLKIRRHHYKLMKKLRKNRRKLL